MLLIFSGLPGTGKTSLALSLAAQLRAVYIRADTIEQSLKKSVLSLSSVEDLGYLASYAVAGDNLKLGHNVIADSVNPWEMTRQAWRRVASQVGAPAIDIEVVCSNLDEHRKRVEGRETDIPGFLLPSWQDVVDRDYHPWTTPRLQVDTYGKSVEACTERLLCEIDPVKGSAGPKSGG